jgi:hypothetical protein
LIKIIENSRLGSAGKKLKDFEKMVVSIIGMMQV